MKDFDDYVWIDRQQYKNTDSAFNFLCHLYKDKYPLLVGEGESFFLYQLIWPLHQLNTDSALEENLKKYFTLQPQSLPHYYKKEHWGNNIIYCETFFHHWALLAWSKWLNATTAPDKQQPVILHFDSHDDLGQPSLFFSQKGLNSFWGNNIFDINHTATVKEFIERGFIGIGGFLLPFLHTHKQCSLHHFFIPQSPECASHFETRKMNIGPQKVIAKTAANQLAVSYSNDYSQDYFIYSQWQQPDMPTLLPVLLDIDMDYFCNDLDDSPGRNDYCKPANAEIKRRIDSFLASVLSSVWKNQLKVITIALSPGFFPSSKWKYFFYLKKKLKKIVG